MSSAAHRGPEEPLTAYPWYFFVEMLVLLLMVGGGCYFIFSSIFELNSVWWKIVFLVTLACIRPALTTYVEPFTARLVLDGFTKKIRCLRKGVSWITPTETLGSMIDLRTDIKGIESESYVSKVGRVLARYVFSMCPDSSSDKALIKYQSWELDAIKQAVRAFISMTLSDYFRDRETDEQILHKSEINKALFGGVEGIPLKKGILDFEEEHGVIVEEIRLEDVDFDDKVQDYRDSITGATQFREGVRILMSKKGLTKTAAEKVMRLLELPNAQEFIITAPDLKNMTHVNIVGGLGASGNKPARKERKK
jgi:hypothetical protein